MLRTEQGSLQAWPSREGQRTLALPGAGAGSKGIMGRVRVNSEKLAKYLFVLPAILYLATFCLYPLYFSIQMSLQDFTSASFVSGVAEFTGFDNFRAIFADPIFAEASLHTVVFVAACIAGQFVLGLLLALFFQKVFPLNSLLRALLLLPWLLPIIVSATISRWMLDQDSGVMNQVLRSTGLTAGLPWLTSPAQALIAVIAVQVWIGIPFCMVILYGGLQNIPGDLYEAAALDGAGAWTKFRNITLPMLRPVSAVVVTLALIYTLKSFDVIWLLTRGGPANATHTLATLSYQRSFIEFNFGRGAAIGDLLLIVSTVAALFYLRSYRRSIRAER